MVTWMKNLTFVRFAGKACSKNPHTNKRKGKLWNLFLDRRSFLSVHSGKKYDCDICGKEYPRKEHVEGHKNRDHFGIKFPCPKCDYKATVMASLKTHIKSKHEGKRSSQCDYNAFDKQTLLRHVNVIHLNIKLFQCDSCDFKASQRGTVNSHVKRNH